MGGYVVNFAVYTMAMIGLIFFALMVYKKCTFTGGIKTAKTKLLNIEETITIAPRKTLYVVKAGKERFLIAGDIDKTTLISKLDNSGIVETSKEASKTVADNTAQIKQTNTKTQEVKQEIEKLYTKNTDSIDDLPVIVDFQKKAQQKNVLHDMLKKINE